ncbi:MAG: hypothetical protein ACXWT5_13565 [Methylophilus sp.]
MALSNLSNEQTVSREQYLSDIDIDSAHVNNSAVSWAAIVAGAAAAAALTLILLLLGAGLGLSSISPWTQKGISASTFGVSTIVWLTVTQILAAGMGGYLAGRLRFRWIDAQPDEVYFRDTAHGFLTWSVATLVTAALIASVVGSVVSGGVQTVTTLTGVAASAAVAGGIAGAQSDNVSGSGDGAMGYIVDGLFRKDANMVSATSTEQITTTPDTAQQSAPTSEVTRILVNAMRMKAMPPADLSYVSQLVARQTGLAQIEAEKRVNDIYAGMQTNARNAELAAKNAADKARKASIYSTLWLFVSLLMGAFSASLAATWGGRCRDA